MSRTKNSIRNVFWGYMYRIINMILPFAFRTVMIYSLGDEYLGINSLFSSILQVLSLSELGFGTAMIYSMYKPVAEKQQGEVNALLKLYKKIYTAVGLFILVAGICVTPFVPMLIKNSYPDDINIYIVYIVFLVNTSISYLLCAYRTSILNVNQRNDITNKISAVMMIVQYGIQIPVVILLKNYYCYIAVIVCMTIVNNLITYIITKKLYPEFVCEGEVSTEKKSDIKKNVAALFVHKVGGMVLNSADTIVISAFFGLAMITKYTNYFYIVTAVEQLVMISFGSVTSILGNSIVVDSKEQVKKNFNNILFFNGWVVCLCSSLMFCLFQPCIVLWVGKKYLFDLSVVVLFVLYFFVHMIRRTIIVFRDAAGMWWDNKYQPIVSATFNLIVNIILVNIIGIYGILLSSIISMVFIDIPWEAKAFFGKVIEQKRFAYFKQLCLYAVVTVVSCFCSYFACTIIQGNNIGWFLVRGIITFAVSNVILLLLFFRNSSFKFFYKTLLNILKKN